MQNSKPIDVKKLRSELTYEPETGFFFWKKRMSQRVKSGVPAGTVKSNSYISICLGGSQFLAHRLAFAYMTGRSAFDEIDHIDGNKQNNSWENLREATRQDNNRNHPLSSRNTSGFLGVSPNKSGKRWKAQIRHNNQVVYLGTFDTKEEAFSARQKAAAEMGYHENHGRVNP